tara:strand:+ start:452 stop:2257 length:1806 start_codon:yes stop_codon:yes gene_type:complete
MSKENQISESEAQKFIEKNERDIDSKNIPKKKKEEEENKDETKEGFIGVNTDRNRSAGARLVNVLVIFVNLAVFFLLFLFVPSYLWFTLSKYEKVPGYSGNQVSGTDPFKPPYTKKAPAGVRSASMAEMAQDSFFSSKKHGWPYTWAQEPDDVGEGDFIWPNVIWANTIRDMFVHARNMFDGFLDLYKGFIGKIPPFLDITNPNHVSTWGDTIITFFRLLWVIAITVVFIAVGTGYLAKQYLGYWIGIPMISLFYATAMTFLDAIRMKECKDKATGLLWSKLWWNTGYNESGWFALPLAKLWRLAYRGFLTSLFFSFNTMIAITILPLYGFYWLLGRPIWMNNTRKAAWYASKKLISKYYIILIILFGLAVAQNFGKEMYPLSVKPRLDFWKGGPPFRGWTDGEFWQGVFKKIVVNYPYILAILMLIAAIVGPLIFGINLIPRSGPKIEKPTGLKIDPKEFTLKKEEQWSYTGNAHLKYGQDGWRDRWREQFKAGLSLNPPCGGEKRPSSSSSGQSGSTAGMQFGNAMKSAAMKQPAVQAGMALNTIANNKNISKPAAIATIGAAALGTGSGAVNAVNTINKVNNVRNAVKKGGAKKRRKR